MYTIHTTSAPMLLAAFIVNCVRTADNSDVHRLELALQSRDNDGPGRNTLSKVAVDAGPDAVPMLMERLADKDEEIRYKAATALAYIGGIDAVAVLRQEYEKRDDPQIKSLLCPALATTGTADDRAFLTKSLASI